MKKKRSPGKKKQARSPIARIIRWSIFLIMLLVVAWALGPLPGLLKSKSELKDLQTRLKKLEKENVQLRKEINAVKKDSYVELLAREQGLTKPGEEIYTVVPGPKPQTTSLSEEKTIQKQDMFSSIKDFLSRLLGYQN